MEFTLKDLTICIFTYERKFELERQVKFWSSTDAKVIILDASNQPAKIANSPNLKYMHVPNMTILKRFLKFSEIADTKYVLLSPDDDYFALKGLSKTLKFLDTNLDFASAQGVRVRFFDFPNFHWIPDYVKQRKLEFIEEEKVQRLNRMAGSMHYIYSVIRTSDFTKIVNCLHDVNTEKRDAVILAELIFNYTLAILGKHTILPVFYSARKAHPYMYGDIAFSNWINDNLDLDRNIFKINMENFYMREIGSTRINASLIFSDLTKSFTIPKKFTALNSKNESKYGYVLKKIIFNSKFSGLHSFSKPTFFKFYFFLFRNSSLILFIIDLHFIKKFLKNNRIGS